MAIECIRFKSFQKGFLQGFADIYVPKWNVEIHGCSLCRKTSCQKDNYGEEKTPSDGHYWVNLPSKEYENDQGEKKFAPILFFREKSQREAFCQQALEAIKKWIVEDDEAERQKKYGLPCEEIPF